MKNENDMNLLYKKWCSINCLPFQSADETLHNLNVSEEQREYLECFIHVSDIHNKISLENFNNSVTLGKFDFKKKPGGSNFKNLFKLQLNDMISTLHEENNYDAVSHLEMYADHGEILSSLLYRVFGRSGILNDFILYVCLCKFGI